MIRLICSLPILLIVCAALATPAPKSGWDKIDPDHDCTFVFKDDTVTIELPGGNHDFAPMRKRFNAPCVLREVEGDFVVQVRVSGSFRPSAESSVEGEDSRVAGGLILIPADKKCIRLEYEASRVNEERLRKEKQPLKGERQRKEVQRRKEELHSGPTFKILGEGTLEMGLEPPWKQDRQAKEEQIYLRLERHGNGICEAISPDGKTWTAHVSTTGARTSPQRFQEGPCAGPALRIESEILPRKIKVGLAAYSTSTEPFKVQFDEFKLIRGLKENK